MWCQELHNETKYRQRFRGLSRKKKEKTIEYTPRYTHNVFTPRTDLHFTIQAVHSLKRYTS